MKEAVRKRSRGLYKNTYEHLGHIWNVSANFFTDNGYTFEGESDYNILSEDELDKNAQSS